MKNKTLFLLIMLSFTCRWTYAQYQRNENNIWIFGARAGIDFNQTPPAPFTSGIGSTQGGSSASQEGCATIADANGNFLFHTDGTTVWDSSDQVMPNGTNILGLTARTTFSTSQGAVIAPVPDSPGQYFIFSLPSWDHTAHYGKLYSSKIRMDLNGGKGDVDTTFPQRHKVVDSLFTERMTVVAGPCFKWLLLFTNDTNSFKAFQITKDGLAPDPVISYAGHFPKVLQVNSHYRQGTLKASPDGNTLVNAMFNPNRSTGPGLEIYDFDSRTGVVSNARIIDSGSFNGADFSPDGSKLYATNSAVNGQVCQFDLSNPDPDSIRSSKTPLGPCALNTEIRLAPNGKLYFARNRGAYTHGNRALASIENPNAKGVLANYRDTAILLDTLTGIMIGLPNIVIMEDRGVENQVITDTSFCYDLEPLTLRVPPGSTSISWSNGSSADSFSVTNEGVYHVSYFNRCHYTDTFRITVGNPQHNLALDTALCPGFVPFDLHVPPGSSSVNWQDGSADGTFRVGGAGVYHVSYSNRCDYVDTFRVRDDFPQWFITVNEMELSASQSFESYQWYLDGVAIPGANDRSLDVQTNGLYMLKVNGGGCTDSSSHRVNNANRIQGPAQEHTVRLYPNPVRGSLHIDAPFPVSFTLSDLSGSILLYREAAEPATDLSGLRPGVYLIRLQNAVYGYNRMHRITLH